MLYRLSKQMSLVICYIYKKPLMHLMRMKLKNCVLLCQIKVLVLEFKANYEIFDNFSQLVTFEIISFWLKNVFATYKEEHRRFVLALFDLHKETCQKNSSVYVNCVGNLYQKQSYALIFLLLMLLYMRSNSSSMIESGGTLFCELSPWEISKYH